jgi:hyperosmotically inducible periplasmic protein
MVADQPVYAGFAHRQSTGVEKYMVKVNPVIAQRSWFALSFAMLILLVGCASHATRESTGEYIDDTAITAKVKAALVGDKEVSALAVNVETYRGVVQLSGFADSQREISKAVSVTRGVGGVKSVKNDLRVKPKS